MLIAPCSTHMLCVVGVAVLRVTGGVVPEVGFDAPSFTYAVELQVRPREKKIVYHAPTSPLNHSYPSNNHELIRPHQHPTGHQVPYQATRRRHQPTS